MVVGAREMSTTHYQLHMGKYKYVCNPPDVYIFLDCTISDYKVSNRNSTWNQRVKAVHWTTNIKAQAALGLWQVTKPREDWIHYWPKKQTSHQKWVHRLLIRKHLSLAGILTYYSFLNSWYHKTMMFTSLPCREKEDLKSFWTKSKETGKLMRKYINIWVATILGAKNL